MSIRPSSNGNQRDLVGSLKDETLNCDFCAEFSGKKNTTFAKLYSGLLDTRVVAREQGFVAIPTIGQIFPGSLLVLPENHVETLASLPVHQRAAVQGFATSLAERLHPANSPVVFFEHGARAHTGGSCGLYHAHLHVVSLPRHVGLQEMFIDDFRWKGDLNAALTELHNSEHYLLFYTKEEGCGFIDINNGKASYPSQYFRRRLAEIMKVDVAWDWRTMQAAEPAVIRAVETFRREHVPQQPHHLSNDNREKTLHRTL